jgi:protein-disulfide isomerase
MKEARMTARLLITAASLGLALTLAACGSDKPASPAADAGPLPAAVPGKDWTTVFTATPEGGFRIGNPDAKVKLVEFASLTCPHCREFHESAWDQLKGKYVASGNVSYEYRNFVLNGPDFAASMLARCQGPEAFFTLLLGFYADQLSWTAPFGNISKADQQMLAGLPEDQQTARLAELGQLDAYVKLRGIPKAKFDQCVSDKAAYQQLLDLRKQATETYKLTGTPSFIINGTVQDNVYTWAELEPKLQAALR